MTGVLGLSPTKPPAPPEAIGTFPRMIGGVLGLNPTKPPAPPEAIPPPVPLKEDSPKTGAAAVPVGLVEPSLFK
jgi:hypothetical protein